jgi:hypothetical protein
LKKKFHQKQIIRIAILFLLYALAALRATAQVRGVYPLGMSALNSGVTPQSGFTYSNMFLFYSRDELKDPNGTTVAVGINSVLLNMNSFIWVSKRTILGGAKFSCSATLPFAKNSLTSEIQGPLSGASGFGDSYYQPFILGWHKDKADIRAVYGFLAPTGKFADDANDNVGSGYWTHALSSGATLYLTQNKQTAISAFQMYEFHTTQEGTGIHPGQTLSVDYSITQLIPLQEKVNLQIGVIGYFQWQTTDKTGPNITPEQAAAHYRVNSLGFASTFIFPSKNASVGVRYFKEFLDKATFQGYSLQLSGAISF